MWDFADIYKRDQFAFSYLTLHEWNYKKLKGKKLKTFLDEYGYSRVVLYSLGTLGCIFAEELAKEGVNVNCIIDERAATLPESYAGFSVAPPEALPQHQDVDAVIICHVYYYNKIADKLVARGIPEEKIISLNDIVFSL